VFEDRVLRGGPGPKREEITRSWRTFQKRNFTIYTLTQMRKNEISRA
jgi:hypothetical protein